jgi:glycosyltransferase involved in cell wall biosynthesis
VLNQEYRNWKLIVVDDGSTDASETVILSAAKAERRITYVRQHNQRLAIARNTGVQMADSYLLAFIDSDDEYAPNHLTLRVRYLVRHPSIDGIYGGMRIVGKRSRHYVPGVNQPGKKIHVARCHVAGTLLVPTLCVRDIGGFHDIPFSEDYDLIRRLEKRFTLRRVNLRTYIYHVDSQNRLCNLFESGGVEGILKFRETGETAQ